MSKQYFINRQQVAYNLGLTVKTVTKYQTRKNDPLPIHENATHGKANKYDPYKVMEWKVRQELQKLDPEDTGEVIDYEKEKARLTKEQADGQEIKNAIARREVAPVPLLEYCLQNIGSQIKSILESIPLKVKKRLPQLKATDIEIIKREIIKAQNAASNCELDFDGFEENYKEG